VSNFKGFRDTITLDLTASNYEFNPECIREGYADKALIYGYNGVGKSNLGLAIMDIIIHLTDKEKVELLTKNYRNLETRNNISNFSYTFKFNNSMVKYDYGKTAPNGLVYEHLYIDNKKIVSYDRKKNEPLAIDLPGTENLIRDLNKIPISVIKYIKSNSVLENSPETSVFLDFIDFVDRMLLFWNLDGRGYLGYSTGVKDIFDDIIEKNHFDDFKDFFKAAELPANLVYHKIGDQLKVFFEYKMLGEKVKSSVEFFTACSTGMRSLSVFYYWLQYIKYADAPPSFVFIDEFDAFYHQLLAEFVMKEIKKVNTCQFILTTHDTSVMSNDILRPDCLFLMYKDKIKSVANSTDKELRLAHNIEKMYRAGMFDE
jgi:AAA15 family ATPase/GTPase